MGQLSDEDLAGRAQAGDGQAFAELVSRYQRTVLNLAYRMLGDAQEAEDVAQEVFIRVYQSLDRFDPSRRFFSWLYRIAVNRCLSVRGRERLDTFAGDERELADSALSPEQQASRAETRAAVQRAIARLPEHERTLVALRYGADLSYEAIAATMQLPIGTVKTRLFRARQRLAQMLQEEGGDPF